MKKIVFVILIATISLFAFKAEVKKETVYLLINDKNISYKAGEIFSLKAGDLVCFISGNGRVVIKGDKYRKQISRHTKSCKTLPSKDNNKKNYISLVTNKIVETFSNTKESVVNGVSSKGSIELINNNLIHLNKNSKYLILKSKEWGPLPVTIQILDNKGEVIISDINDNDDLASFIFPIQNLKDGYIINIYDGFDKLKVKSTIRMD